MLLACWDASPLDPPPTGIANLAGGEAGRLPHQRWSEFAARAEPYELHAAQRENWVFSPSYPAQSVWTYQAKEPGLEHS